MSSSSPPAIFSVSQTTFSQGTWRSRISYSWYWIHIVITNVVVRIAWFHLLHRVLSYSCNDVMQESAPLDLPFCIWLWQDMVSSLYDPLLKTSTKHKLFKDSNKNFNRKWPVTGLARQCRAPFLVQSKISLLSTFPYLGYFVCTAALNDYQERTTIALSILNKMHYGSTI